MPDDDTQMTTMGGRAARSVMVAALAVAALCAPRPEARRRTQPADSVKPRRGMDRHCFYIRSSQMHAMEVTTRCSNREGVWTIEAIRALSRNHRRPNGRRDIGYRQDQGVRDGAGRKLPGARASSRPADPGADLADLGAARRVGSAISGQANAPPRTAALSHPYLRRTRACSTGHEQARDVAAIDDGSARGELITAIASDQVVGQSSMYATSSGRDAPHRDAAGAEEP